MSDLRRNAAEGLRLVINEPAVARSKQKPLGVKSFHKGVGLPTLPRINDRSSHNQSKADAHPWICLHEYYHSIVGAQVEDEVSSSP
jgi:hypothetical protein